MPPILFPLLKGPLGAVGVGRQLGGVGPFRPWLKSAPADGAWLYPDAWRLPQLPKPIMFLIEAGLMKGLVSRGSRLPLPAISAVITGVSRDASGVALGGCTCTLFKVTQGASDAQGVSPAPVFTQVATTVSDGSGNYSFVVGFDGPYRVTFDLAGAPIRAGITLKSLTGV